jgi:hypothetical protein
MSLSILSEGVMVWSKDLMKLCRDNAWDELGIIDMDHACPEWMNVLCINHNYGEVEIEETSHTANNGNTNVKESLYTIYTNYKEN